MNFQGYSDETFSFFMALRFNNNTQFFHENHDWYLRAVREPSLALAEKLNDAIEALDENLERRPNRVVSRINRDLRYAKGQPPYRDYIWLHYYPVGVDKSSAIGLYFDVSADSSNYGMGVFNENRPLMNGLRREMVKDPDRLTEILTPLTDEFTLFANCVKRMKPPETLPSTLQALYPAKGFYLQKTIRDFGVVKSPALADEIIGGIAKLTPLYKYLSAISPED